MPSINVDGAAARLLANRTLAAAGYCLHYCWLAISQGLVHYITGGAGSAYATWLAVPADHRHYDRNVPKDMPAFLGPRFLSSEGDVIISNGDGTFAATDWPRSKHVGTCTLTERETQTGRKFVGWASSMGGYELTVTSVANETSTLIKSSPSLQEDPTMRFMNRTQDNVVAIFDESHWQEISYSVSAPAGSPLATTTQYVTGLVHTLAEAPYDATGWDYRSNRSPNLKRTLYTIASDGSLEPINPVTAAVDNSAVLDAIRGIPTAVQNGTAARDAIVK